MLTKEESKRYFKQILLDEVGLSGQLKIKRAKVAVIGAGGLGCPVLQYLTSVGVGEIGIIDFDIVDVSNLHRQILYTETDIGQPKTKVAIERLLAQNPYVVLREHRTLLSEENINDVLISYDIIVDGCDNFLTRYLINDYCVKMNKPLVYGSILGFEGQLALFNYNGSKNLRDIFPEPPNPEEVPNCNENGVLGTLPAIIGSMMAQEVLNVILEKVSLTNTLVLYNSLQHYHTKIKY